MDKKNIELFREYLVTMKESYENTPADNIEQLMQRDSLIVILEDIIVTFDGLINKEE